MFYNYYSNSTGNDVAKENVDESIIQEIDIIDKQRQEATRKEGELLYKAMSSSNPDVILKAQEKWHDIQPKQEEGLRSEIFDPNNSYDAGGYKVRQFGISDNLLRRMVEQTPVVWAAINHRQTQVGDFAVPQKDKYSTGFVVRKKREFYSSEDPTLSKKDKETIKYITKFLLNCGDDNNKWTGTENFDAFLKLIVADSLTFDKACFEIGRDNGDSPYAFQAVDGSTMFFASTKDDDKKDVSTDSPKVKGYTKSHAQVIDSCIKNDYYPWEMCMGIRNTSTDIRKNGYGTSEVEILMKTITDLLNSDTYNGRVFSQGTNAKGVFISKPGSNRNTLQNFQRQWKSQMEGLDGAHKIAMLEGEDMQWFDMQKSNKDMEFGTWQEHLIRYVCAVFKVAPEELGFKLGNSSGSGEGLGGDATKEKIKYSKDKGLKPLLTSIQGWINKYLIEAIDSDFEFVFAGMDSEDMEKEIDTTIKMVGSFMGWKEAREKMGLPAELADGDFPLNNVYTSFQTQQMYADQSQQNTDQAEGQSDEDWKGLGDESKDKETQKSMHSLGLDFTNPMMVDAFTAFQKSVNGE